MKNSIERLAKLGELWSAVRYFHPYLAYQPIDWDAALARAVPLVLAGGDSDTYEDAIRSMLAAVEDPITRILPPEVEAETGSAEPAGERTDAGQPRRDLVGTERIAHWADEGILCLSLNTTTLGSDFRGAERSLTAVLPMLRGAKGVVLDLRSTKPCAWLETLVGASRLDRAIVPRPLTAPGERLRMHHGLKGERSPYSSSGFQTMDGAIFAPGDWTSDIPTVFLINAMTRPPRVMLALQDAGRASVVAEGAVTDESLVRTHALSMGEGVRVRMRLGELVHPDGTTSYTPDVVVPATLGETVGDPPLRCALDLVRNFPMSRPRRPTLSPFAAPPPDSAYADTPYPSLGYRVLAAIRIWGAIHYFFPYRDLMDDDWDAVLRSYLPRFIEAADALAYHLAIAEMYTYIRDSHGYVLSDTLASHFGSTPCAVYARWIEDQPVVCGFRDEEAAGAAGAEIGDVIVEVDGERALDRIDRYARHVAASTPQRLMARVADFILFGPDGSAARLTVRGRDGGIRTLDVPRRGAYPVFPEYRSGAVARRIDREIGYIDLARLERSEADAVLEGMMDASAIIFDLRGYPKPLAPWTILQGLARDEEAPVARIDRPLLLGPTEGDRQWTTLVQKLGPRDPRRHAYRGRTVTLIDDRTQSMGEHAGLFLQATGTTFVGGRSAGADGDVTSFTVAGGVTLLLSGQAVRHADGRQLQRVGLIPHIEVRPTVEGIRAGRDEVLGAAVGFIHGS